MGHNCVVHLPFSKVDARDPLDVERRPPARARDAGWRSLDMNIALQRGATANVNSNAAAWQSVSQFVLVGPSGAARASLLYRMWYHFLPVC
jgi:hypothetical protein